MIEMFDKDFLASCKKKPEPRFKLGQAVYFPTIDREAKEGQIVGIDMSIWDGKYEFNYTVATPGHQTRWKEKCLLEKKQEETK